MVYFRQKPRSMNYRKELLRTEFPEELLFFIPCFIFFFKVVWMIFYIAQSIHY